MTVPVPSRPPLLQIEKPKFGAPCNGCGFCCRNEVCGLGKAVLGDDTPAPCPLMRFDGAKGFAQKGRSRWRKPAAFLGSVLIIWAASFFSARLILPKPLDASFDDLVVVVSSLKNQVQVGSLPVRLFVKIGALHDPKVLPLKKSDKEQQDGKGSHDAVGDVVIRRRFLILWVGVGWCLLCWWLDNRSYQYRPYVGLVGLCGLAFGLLLWCLTPYRWTWGWWL